MKENTPRQRAPWWMYLIAAAFLGHYGLQIYTASPFYPGPGRIGIIRDFKGGSNVVESVVPDSLAEKAGIRAGDRIVAVDGFPTPGTVEFDVRAMTFEAGMLVHLEVARDGKRIPFEVILGQRSENGLSWQGWLLAAGNLFTLSLALVVAFRRPFDLGARMGGWFLATAAISIFPPVPGFAAAIRHLPLPIGALLWLAISSEQVFPAILFTFCAVFPRTLFRGRWVWWLVWLPAVLAANPLFLMMLATVYRLPLPVLTFQPSIAAIFAFRGCYLLAGLTALVVNYRRLTDLNERRRVRVLVIGSVVGWIAIGIFLTLIIVGDQTLASYGSLLQSILIFLFLAFPVSFAYAILRHRVFDLGLMIRQGLQYALARRLLLSLLPALVAILMVDLLTHRDQTIGAILQARGWAYVVVGGLAIAAHTKRHEWMQALDRRFFRERYDAQRLLRDVVEEVRSAGNFQRIAPIVVAQIEAALHPEFAALLIREPRETSYRTLSAAPAGASPPPLPVASKLIALVRLLGKPLEVARSESGWLQQQLPHEDTDYVRRARMDLLVPVAIHEDRTEALLALGIKRSEEPYSREDRDLLIAIAASLALILEQPATEETPPRVSQQFGECPQCGTCYDSNTNQCAKEGAELQAVSLPRLLSDRYRLERRLGRGGMGTVYEATDSALDRRVAAKVIRDDLVSSAEAGERFRREARAAASFTHPNVVTVHDFGLTASARAFLIMELLQGSSLREEMLRVGRLPAPRVVEILRGVTAAVVAAHRRKLLHRDLKPENIFLARTEAGETPKVLDFGVAKFLPDDTQVTRDADTGAGVRLGTARYMSPEQLQFQEPDPLWDLWALAIVAYEMLTGVHPFSGPTSAEFHRNVFAGAMAPMAASLPKAPQKWQLFFEKALAREAARRHQSAGQFFTELEKVLR